MNVGQALKDAWTSEIAPHVNANACILGTRVSIEALSYFGIKARPLPCALFVANPPAIKWLSNPANDKNEAIEKMPPEAHTIGIHPDMPPERMVEQINGYPAHLVAAIDADSSIVDLTLSQIKRDKPNMRDFGPAILSVPKEFLHDEEAARVVINDCYLDYKVLSDMINGEYRFAKDWREHKEHTAKVIRFMKKALDG